MSNEIAIKAAGRNSENTVIGGWLPQCHDFGLITLILQPLFLGCPSILMSPIAFVQRPLRWLQIISRYQISVSGGPNFAYDLCVSKIAHERCHNLDLSCWKVAVTGAEPIRAATLRLFYAAFAEYGFRYEAFVTAFGMAEATVLLTSSDKSTMPVTLNVSTKSLEHNTIVTMETANAETRTLVGCGRAPDSHSVLIVNPDTRCSCRADEVGEIWASGPSIAEGYWNNPTETQPTFHAYLADTGEGPFLRTGDLGFVHGGPALSNGANQGHHHYSGQ